MRLPPDLEQAAAVTFLKLGAMGRLGNQLFQLAATLGVAHRTKLRAVFPSWEYDQWFDVHTAGDEWFSRRPWVVVKPDSFRYDATVDHRVGNGGASLEGFFQSERYFDDCGDVVRQAILTPRVLALKKEVAANHGVSEGDNVCAIHVRRGDYLSITNKFLTLPLDYYHSAIQWMLDNKSVTRFMVVSDDLKWCRKHFTAKHFAFSDTVRTARDRAVNSDRSRRLIRAVSAEGAVRISRCGTERTLKDLLLMATCRHHIIANSSFSWWSSWLSSGRDRAVIAPAVWATPTLRADTVDVYRGEMTLM